jgi:hypothetical protein
MIVALIALAFSMGGTAIAASHYLITNIHQVSPHVLGELATLKLKKVESAGPAGPEGKASTVPGPEGKQGPPGVGVTGLTGPQGESIVGPRGEPGPVSTVPGPRGEPGERGPQGEPGSAFAEVREENSTGRPIAPEGNGEAEVKCPGGTRPIGGGYEASEATIRIYAEHAAGDWGWIVQAHNDSPVSEGTVTAQVFCAA